MNIIGRLGGGVDVVFGKEHLENGANLGTMYLQGSLQYKLKLAQKISLSYLNI